MASSIFNPAVTIDKENLAVNLVYIGSRENNIPGEIGFLILEGINEKDQYFQLCISSIFAAEPNEMSSYCISKIEGFDVKTRFPDLLTQTYSIPKAFVPFECVENDYDILQPGALKTYSFKKACVACQVYFGFSPSIDKITKEATDVKPMHYNPFARLIESQNFPFARLRRSSLWTRIKDTFFIFAGDHDLGLLDYVFPLPKLLEIFLNYTNSSDRRNNVLASFILVPLMIFQSMKVTAAAIFTVVCAPLLGLVNLGFLLFTYPQLVEHLAIYPILGNVETFEDIGAGNVADEALSLGIRLSVDEELTIKPLYQIHNKKRYFSNFNYSSDSYTTNFTQESSDEDESKRDLVLGVQNKEGKPIGIIAPSENQWTLKKMMFFNHCHIDETLEQAGPLILDQFETMLK
jgi:hypothetical protein